MVKKKTENKGRVYSIIGLICAILSILIFPIVFGVIAITLGIFARKKGDATFGLVVIILGAVFMVIGMIIGAVVNVLLNAPSY
jgi:O-antigen/teichoic acid export membrane protein